MLNFRSIQCWVKKKIKFSILGNAQFLFCCLFLIEAVGPLPKYTVSDLNKMYLIFEMSFLVKKFRGNKLNHPAGLNAF